MTGSSSGIGVETARALAAQGAEVTLAVRNLASGQRVADSIAKGTGISVLVTHVDLTELASVQRFTAAWDGRCTSSSTTPVSWLRPALS